MLKFNMLCHAWWGARDLYHGVPNLEVAVVEKVKRDENDICTVLHLKKKDGEVFKIGIVPSE